jgi:hypothetical protein
MSELLIVFGVAESWPESVRLGLDPWCFTAEEYVTMFCSGGFTFIRRRRAMRERGVAVRALREMSV